MQWKKHVKLYVCKVSVNTLIANIVIIGDLDEKSRCLYFYFSPLPIVPTGVVRHNNVNLCTEESGLKVLTLWVLNVSSIFILLLSFFVRGLCFHEFEYSSMHFLVKKEKNVISCPQHVIGKRASSALPVRNSKTLFQISSDRMYTYRFIENSI